MDNLLLDESSLKGETGPNGKRQGEGGNGGVSILIQSS